jgi:hypothetical protein
MGPNLPDTERAGFLMCTVPLGGNEPHTQQKYFISDFYFFKYIILFAPLSTFFFFFLVCRQSHNKYSSGWSRTPYVDQAGLETQEICLPLPPKCWIKHIF